MRLKIFNILLNHEREDITLRISNVFPNYERAKVLLDILPSPQHDQPTHNRGLFPRVVFKHLNWIMVTRSGTLSQSSSLMQCESAHGTRGFPIMSSGGSCMMPNMWGSRRGLRNRKGLETIYHSHKTIRFLVSLSLPSFGAA
jgi:hypothetical protein